MPRKQARELRYGRVGEWKSRMSEFKKIPGYPDDVDMQDAESIRKYVRDAIARDLMPSIAGLKRLEMMTAIADSLPQRKPAQLLRIDPVAAAAELQRREQQGTSK